MGGVISFGVGVVIGWVARGRYEAKKWPFKCTDAAKNNTETAGK